MNESELIKKIIAGEKNLFSDVVNKHQKAVINICNGFVHDIDIAQDIAQDVFIEIWKSLAKYRGDSKLSTWIYRISVNKSLNYIRKVKRYKKEDIISIQQDKEISLTIEEESVAEIEKELSEKYNHIYQAIDKLPNNQRIAFIMCKYQELSYREISETMNLSLSSVESLIHRAKMNLQKKLIHLLKK